MPQISATELLIIIIILILLFSSEKLSQLARELGKNLREINKEIVETKAIISPVESPLSIFVSSMIDELLEERNAIAEAVQQIPVMRPWLFEQSPPSSDPVEDVYLDHVKNADIFVLLIGHAVSNAVLKEYDVALKARKPIIVLIKSCERDQIAREFIRGLNIKWNEFSTIEELQSLTQIALTTELIKGYRRYRLTNEQLTSMVIFLESSKKDSTLRGRLWPFDMIGTWEISVGWNRGGANYFQMLFKENGKAICLRDSGRCTWRLTDENISFEIDHHSEWLDNKSGWTDDKKIIAMGHSEWIGIRKGGTMEGGSSRTEDGLKGNWRAIKL